GRATRRRVPVAYGPGSWVHQSDAHPAVMAALVVDLQDPERPRGACLAQVRPAAGLAVQPDDVDDADPAIGRRRRRDRLGTDQAVFPPGLVQRYVDIAHRQVLPDRVVEGAFDGADALVVRAGQVEIHPGDRKSVV